MKVSFEEAKDSMEKQLSAGRMGTVEEFASIVCFLCSEQASYISGQNISGWRKFFILILMKYLIFLLFTPTLFSMDMKLNCENVQSVHYERKKNHRPDQDGINLRNRF